MRKKNYKGRCEKQTLEKFTTICKTYDPIQSAYAMRTNWHTPYLHGITHTLDT